MGKPKVGFEIEFKAYAILKKYDEPNKIYSLRDEIYRPQGQQWALHVDRLIHYNDFIHSLEFVTDPWDNDESKFQDRVNNLKSIKLFLEKILYNYWNKGKTMEYQGNPESFSNTLRYLISKFSQHLPYSFSCISKHLEWSFWDMQAGYGVNGEKTVVWKINSNAFNVDEIKFCVPLPYSFTQATIGIEPEKLFTVVKKLAAIEGLGFSIFTVGHYISIAEDTFDRCNVTDESAKGFLYLVGSYIAAGRSVNIPFQWYHDLCGYYKMFSDGIHKYLFPYAKQFTEINGILCRNAFHKMFKSLSKDTQNYIRLNIWNIVADMLYDYGGHEIFDETFFRFGHNYRTVRVHEFTKWQKIWRTMTSDPSFVKKGPVIKDWINGFLNENTDFLVDLEVYGSMGQMEMDGDLWLIELRTGPADMMCVPIDGPDGKIRPVVYGFTNVLVMCELLQLFQRLSLSEIQNLSNEQIDKYWFEYVDKFKHLFLSPVDLELFHDLIFHFGPQTKCQEQLKHFKRWELLHL